MSRKKPVGLPALTSWVSLNDDLRTADEARCRELLEAEQKGRCRTMFIRRIYSRLNRVRAARERQELGVPNEPK
jgi:hypothetical protein